LHQRGTKNKVRVDVGDMQFKKMDSDTGEKKAFVVR
jgi:hypothetical protein